MRKYNTRRSEGVGYQLGLYQNDMVALAKEEQPHAAIENWLLDEHDVKMFRYNYPQPADESPSFAVASKREEPANGPYDHMETDEYNHDRLGKLARFMQFF